MLHLQHTIRIRLSAQVHGSQVLRLYYLHGEFAAFHDPRSSHFSLSSLLDEFPLILHLGFLMSVQLLVSLVDPLVDLIFHLCIGAYELFCRDRIVIVTVHPSEQLLRNVSVELVSLFFV